MQRRRMDRTTVVLAAVMGALLTLVTALTLGLLLTILATSACYEYPENTDMSLYDMSKTIKLPHMFPGDGKKRYARWELVVAVGFTALMLAGSAFRFCLEVATAWDNSKTEGPLSIKVGMNKWLWRKYLELYQFIDVDAPPKLLEAARSEKRLVQESGLVLATLQASSCLVRQTLTFSSHSFRLGSGLDAAKSPLLSGVGRGKSGGPRPWFTTACLALKFSSTRWTSRWSRSAALGRRSCQSQSLAGLQVRL